MNPATVLTVTAIAGAVGIWRLTRDSTPDRDRPAETPPDPRADAEHADLIPKGGPTP